MRKLANRILGLVIALSLSTSLIADVSVKPPIGAYVGELQERWQFPSDHLPIGLTIGEFYLLSWNILDADYMDWVIKEDSQGLKRSLIADLHQYVAGSKLTLRDIYIAELVVQMSLSDRPRGLIALQECSEPFLQELRSRLPDHLQLISHRGESTLIDLTRFDVVSARAITGVFLALPYRSFQEVVIQSKQDGMRFRFLNVHLPGDPNGLARYEFAQYLADTLDPDVITIALGDMNFNESEMLDALQRAFNTTDLPCEIHSPYCTNISPYVFHSKAIDHFIVFGAKGSTDKPEQVMPGLAVIVELLSAMD